MVPSKKTPARKRFTTASKRSARVTQKNSVQRQQIKDTCRVAARFSSYRVQKCVASLDAEQKDIISKYGLQNILQVSRINVPVQFLEWIMSHTCTSSSRIVVGENSIPITKPMVIKILGIPNGNETVVTDSTNTGVQNIVSSFRHQYAEGSKYPISKCDELIKNNHDEVSFIRSFMLLLISSILAPGKDNCSSIEYLYSLIDVSKISSYDWAGMVLKKVMTEVDRYHSNVNSPEPEVGNSKHYYEGFIPLLAIIYTDFLDLQGHHFQLNYGTPRICSFSLNDFHYVSQADRDPNSDNSYGSLQIRDISVTPYNGLDLPNYAEIAATNTPLLAIDCALNIPTGVNHNTSSPAEATTPPHVSNALDPETQAIVDRMNLYWNAQFNEIISSYVKSVQHLHSTVVSKLVTELAAVNTAKSTFRHPFSMHKESAADTNVDHVPECNNGSNPGTTNAQSLSHVDQPISSNEILGKPLHTTNIQYASTSTSVEIPSGSDASPNISPHIPFANPVLSLMDIDGHASPSNGNIRNLCTPDCPKENFDQSLLMGIHDQTIRPDNDAVHPIASDETCGLKDDALGVSKVSKDLTSFITLQSSYSIGDTDAHKIKETDEQSHQRLTQPPPTNVNDQIAQVDSTQVTDEHQSKQLVDQSDQLLSHHHATNVSDQLAQLHSIGDTEKLSCNKLDIQSEQPLREPPASNVIVQKTQLDSIVSMDDDMQVHDVEKLDHIDSGMQQQQLLLPAFLIALPAIATDGPAVQNPVYAFSSETQQPHDQSFHQVQKQTYNTAESHNGNLDLSTSNPLLKPLTDDQPKTLENQHHPINEPAISPGSKIFATYIEPRRSDESIQTNVKATDLPATHSEVEVEATICKAINYANTSPTKLFDVAAINSTFGDNAPIEQQAKADPKNEVDVKGLGTSTIDLKNRKKRKALNLVQNAQPSSDVAPDVEVFYLTLTRNALPKRPAQSKKEDPPFVQVEDIAVSYLHFYESFKPRGELYEIAMIAHSRVFNAPFSLDVAPDISSDVSSPKKIVFSSYLTQKLLYSTSFFQPRSVLKELKDYEKSVKFSNAHLLFFPMLREKHWMLLCINVLYKKTNFFDSLDIISTDKKSSLLKTLLNNFSKSCVEAGIFSSPLQYTEDGVVGYPKQSNITDCGFYVMCYIDNWNGSQMNTFGQEHVDTHRKIYAYNIAKSPLNKINSMDILTKKDNKKRKT